MTFVGHVIYCKRGIMTKIVVYWVWIKICIWMIVSIMLYPNRKVWSKLPDFDLVLNKIIKHWIWQILGFIPLSLRQVKARQTEQSMTFLRFVTELRSQDTYSSPNLENQAYPDIYSTWDLLSWDRGPHMPQASRITLLVIWLQAKCSPVC